jgi:argonaute-like protein implicated in RNA metabolism and viral defense
LLGYFNVKVWKEDDTKPATENESLHEIGNDNEVRTGNFATLKNLIVKNTVFQISTSVNTLGLLLV